MPADGRLVLEQFERTRRRFIEFGLDYSGTFYNDGRSATNVNLILYDKDDAEQKERVRKLFIALIKDAKEQGYGEYRTHLSYMDDVADSYDFNHNAMTDGASLSTVHAVADVVANSTTLINNTIAEAGHLAYLLSLVVLGCVGARWTFRRKLHA